MLPVAAARPAAMRELSLRSDAHALHEAFAQIGRDLDFVAEQGIAAGLDLHHVARGDDLARFLVVADFVGQQPALPGADLDIAPGGDDVVLGVVDQAFWRLSTDGALPTALGSPSAASSRLGQQQRPAIRPGAAPPAGAGLPRSTCGALLSDASFTGPFPIDLVAGNPAVLESPGLKRPCRPRHVDKPALWRRRD